MNVLSFILRGKMVRMTNFSTLLLSVITIALALLPNQIAGQEPVTFHVVQRSVFSSGNPGRITNTTTCKNECVQIENVHLPTLINLTSNPPLFGSYLLLGYSTDCDPDLPRTLPSTVESFGDGDSIIVNKRKPISSFRLGNQPENKLEVIFFGQQYRGRTVTYNHTVTDTSCIDLDTSPIWDKYVQSVDIVNKRDGQKVTNDFINIFSGQNCTGEEINPEVRSGANLAEMSWEDPIRAIRSFVVVSDEEAGGNNTIF